MEVLGEEKVKVGKLCKLGARISYDVIRDVDKFKWKKRVRFLSTKHNCNVRNDCLNSNYHYLRKCR